MGAIGTSDIYLNAIQALICHPHMIASVCIELWKPVTVHILISSAAS